jgi:UDP-N-acetylglucosamine diphosphorylase/glucosamine-1-phosphate N-acetyltransferase
MLAAGQGKRMHPLSYTRPKVMLPIANKPILEWNILHAKQAGIKEFIIIVGYKSEMVRNYFGTGKQWNVNIEYINQGKPLGTAHAIQMAEPFVTTFIVLCGDTIFGVNDIKKITKKPSSIGILKVDNPKEYGIVQQQGNTIIHIYEKVDDPFSNLINAGIYHFSKTIFNYIAKTEKSPRGEYEITDSINMLVKKEKLHGIPLTEWKDIIYPWHLLDMNQEKLRTIKTTISGHLEKNCTIKGPVHIGPNTTILNGSYIEGPVIIGANCKIGPNCYIRPYTAIGDTCHIGHACEIKNSILMNNTNIPHQNYIGDSIIGENCNIGAGTKIANLRLDKKPISFILNGKTIQTERRKLGAIIGDNVQIGINASINIGTNIGNNSYIGPGALVSGQIEPQSHLR